MKASYNLFSEFRAAVFLVGALTAEVALSASPGNVTQDLHFWVKADTGGVSWADQSPENHAVTSIGSPALAASLINFNPQIEFGGSGSYSTTLNIDTTSGPDASIISIYTPNVNSSGSVWGSDDQGWDRFILDASFCNDGISDGSGSCLVDVPNTYRVGRHHLSSVIYKEDAANGSSIRIDGKNERNFSADNGPQSASPFHIGQIGSGIHTFNGKIAEVIVYKNDLSSATQLAQIESYLATKYGFTLSEGSAQDYLASDGTPYWNGDASYQNDIFGVGRDDDSALNQRVSQSINAGSILTVALDNDFTASNQDPVRTTNFAQDASYWMAGNNGGATTVQTTELPASGKYERRLAREWKVQGTNFNQDLYLHFDGNGTSGTTIVELIKHTSDDFSSAPATVGRLDSNGKVLVPVGLLSSGDYFTVAIYDNVSPTVAQPIADQTASEDSVFSFVLPAGTFADANPTDAVTLTATGLPAWLSFDAATGTFSGTPANGDVGGTSITVTGTDSGNGSVSDSFYLTVANVNDAPTVVDQAASVGEFAPTGTSVITLTATDQDPGNTTLTWTMPTASSLFSLESDGELIVAGALDFETASSHSLSVEVSDGSLSATATVTVTVTDEDEITRIINNPPVTAASLTAEGVTGAVAGNEAAYTAAVAAASPKPRTKAELQALVDEVNAVATAVGTSPLTAAALTTAGVTGAVAGNEAAYTAAVAAANPKPRTKAELQALVDEVNAVATAVGTSPLTAAALTTAGVTGAVAGNEAAYTAAVAAANPKPRTKAELQALVDEVNAVATAVGTSPLTAAALTTAGVTGAVAGNEAAYTAAVAAASPKPRTKAELQALVDEVNAVATAVGTTPLTAAALTTAGVTGAVAGNEAAYTAAVAAANPKPRTKAELQALVDEVNAVATAVAADPVTETLIAAAGVTGAVAGNEAAYTAAVAAANPKPRTQAELQALVDEVNAVATAVAADPVTETLIAAAGVTGAVAGNEAAYTAAIAAANPKPRTQAELQALVDEVNAVAVAVGTTPLTAAALTTAGVTGAVAGNEAAYTAAVAAASPKPRTKAELQALVDEVNAVATAVGTSPLTAAALTTAGVTGAVAGNEAAYTAAIAAANPKPRTKAELQALVDEVNAVAVAVGTTPLTAAALTTAGVTGAVAGNEAAYTAAVAAANPKPRTKAELQALVDEVNAVATAVAADPVTETLIAAAGVTGAVAGNEAAYTAAIAAANPKPRTQAELQALVDEVNAVAVAVGTTPLTAAALTTAGVTGAVAGNEAAYTAAVAAASPKPRTKAELQALVDEVNAVATAVGTSPLTAAALTTAGVTGAVAGNEAAYTAAVAAANPKPRTKAELQALVDEVNAVATAVAADPVTETLIAAAGVTGAVAGNEAAYTAAVAAANPKPRTQAELQALVDEVNAVAVAVGTTPLTAAALTTAGVTGAVAGNEAAYTAAVAAANPKPRTKAELQALVDEVNAVAVAVGTSPLTVAALTTAGVTGAVAGNEAAYTAAIAAANPKPRTQAELQALVDEVNAVAVAVGTTPLTAAALTTAGVTGAVAGNEAAYTAAIAAANPKPRTQAELQALVDEVNAVAVAVGTSPLTAAALTTAGVTGAVAGNEAAYTAAVAAANPKPRTKAELQALVDEVNAVAAAVAADPMTEALITAAGVTGAVAGNEAAYTAAVAAAIPKPRTQAELQALVDEVNAVATAVGTSPLTAAALTTAGVTGAVAGNEAAYTAAVAAASPKPRTKAELQALVDEVNTVATAVAADPVTETLIAAAGVTGAVAGNEAAYTAAVAAANPKPRTKVELQALVDEVNVLQSIVHLAMQIHAGEASNETSGFAQLIASIAGMPSIDTALLGEFAAMVDRANPAPTTTTELIALAQKLNARANTHPVVYLTVKQGGKQVQQVLADGGMVTVTAHIDNPAPAFTPSFDWSGVDTALLSRATEANPMTEILTIDPRGLDEGTSLDFQAKVSRNGLDANAALRAFVVAAGTDVIDSDGDGVLDTFEGDLDASTTPAAANKIQAVRGNDTGFIMEGEGHTRLRLGEVARAAKRNQSRITLNDIVLQVPGVTAQNVINGLPAEPSIDPELFDFEIAQLSHAGSSALLVIPLSAELSAGAQYYKYHPATGWVAFTSDGLNQVFSAPPLGGIVGQCPPTGHAAYTQDLQEGHACVQLMIEDGGPNDSDRLNADGTVASDGGLNGNIKDPGMITYRVKTTGPTVITGVRGSGAVGIGWLGLIAMVLVRHRRKVWFVVASTLGAASPSVLAERSLEEHNFHKRWFVGGGLGQSTLEPGTNSDALSITSNGDSSATVLFGLDLSPRFALEAYTGDLGGAAISLRGNPAGEVDYTVYGLSVLAYTPIMGWRVNDNLLRREKASAYLRLGAGGMQNDASGVEYKRAHDSAFVLGVGLEYGWFNGFAMRAEYTSFDEDASNLSLSLLKRFGQSQESYLSRGDVTEPTVSDMAALGAVEEHPVALSTAALLDSCEPIQAVVRFDPNEDILQVDNELEIFQNYQTALSDGLQRRVVVTGHADSTHTESYNLALSERRAESVVEYIDSLIGGAIEWHVSTHAMGEMLPIASNDTVHGRAQNRRVELNFECF